MAESVLPEPDTRVGSAWLAGAGGEDRNALLVALLSRFNHDLRTPLNTVVGWTHLLQQGAVDTARSRHVADVLARNAREQTVLLDEFVDDARAVLGVLRIDPVQLGVEELTGRALERAAPLLSLHGVTINPATALVDGAVAGDERRLGRLVYRLLAAVVRRTREGAAVAISTKRDADRLQWRFTGEATGADWADALLLDLRISAYVAELHSAELIVDSTPERPTIILRIPLRA